MGFFDDLLKNVDKSLKAVESGALEERLSKFADTIDSTSKQAESRLGKVADKPAEILKVAEAKKDELADKVKKAGGEVRKNIDIVQG